eukprot:UN20226
MLMLPPVIVLDDSISQDTFKILLFSIFEYSVYFVLLILVQAGWSSYLYYGHPDREYNGLYDVTLFKDTEYSFTLFAMLTSSVQTLGLFVLKMRFMLC